MIIGLTGKQHVGKDTVAEYLVKNYHFKHRKFAAGLYQAVETLDPFVQLVNGECRRLSDLLKVHDWTYLKKNVPECRRLLECMGTEVGRNIFGQHIWADIALNAKNVEPKIVFSDVRFLNEVDRIKLYRGMIVRVVRPNDDYPQTDHSSNIELDNYPADCTLFNNKTIEDLRRRVDHMMITQGL